MRGLTTVVLPDLTTRANKKAPISGAFCFLLPESVVGLTQVFVDGLMQMPDPAFLIAGENDLAGR